MLIHPGEMIKDEIESRGITQKKLAETTGISPSVLNEMLNGKRAVSTEYALLLEAALLPPKKRLASFEYIFYLCSINNR